MSSSDGKGSCLLEVDSALELAHYEGGAMGVVRVEVWGCGGEMAAESQRRMKEWEKKEILRRRKVCVCVCVCVWCMWVWVGRWVRACVSACACLTQHIHSAYLFF